MTALTKNLLLWTPRALSIAFAVFLSLFALDVFGEGLGFAKTLLALAMHLIPTAMVVAVLVLAWRWEWIGAVACAALGVAYMVRMPTHPDWWIVISGPLFLLAVLFGVGWWKHAELHAPK